MSKARAWPRAWQMPGPRAAQNLQMPHPEPERAKLARKIEELRENVKTASDTANHFKNFPTVDSAFGNDFILSFPRLFRLIH